jgi:hypothetical protein
MNGCAAAAKRGFLSFMTNVSLCRKMSCQGIGHQMVVCAGSYVFLRGKRIVTASSRFLSCADPGGNRGINGCLDVR